MTNACVAVQRESFDEEVAAMSPEEREAYLKEFDEADRSGAHKPGGLIEKRMFSPNGAMTWVNLLTRM